MLVKAELPSAWGCHRAKGHRGQRESWDCLGSRGEEGGRKQRRVTQRAWERVCSWSLVRAARGNERQAGK